MSADYAFLTTWRVAGTIAEVRDVLGDATALPRWWPSVYLDVRILDEGESDGTGRVLDVYTKGWLPYTLRWAITITQAISDDGFELAAAGDFSGTGVWTFEQDGPEAVITYDWRIRAEKPLLRRLTWLLRPIFSANHHWAMARGEESLRLEMRRRRAGRRRVPRAPGPTFAWLLRRRTI